jgi:hypothetical protein
MKCKTVGFCQVTAQTKCQNARKKKNIKSLPHVCFLQQIIVDRCHPTTETCPCHADDRISQGAKKIYQQILHASVIHARTVNANHEIHK